MVVRLDGFKADVTAALSGLPGLIAITFRGGAIVENGTYDLIPGAPYALRVMALEHTAGPTTGMAFTANVLLGATSVTGLGAVSVASGNAVTTNATGNQVVAAGGIVTVVITGAAGTPTGGRLVLRFERA